MLVKRENDEEEVAFQRKLLWVLCFFFEVIEWLEVIGVSVELLEMCASNGEFVELDDGKSHLLLPRVWFRNDAVGHRSDEVFGIVETLRVAVAHVDGKHNINRARDVRANLALLDRDLKSIFNPLLPNWRLGVGYRSR